MKVLVTGSNGFIGKNLIVRLRELGISFETYTRGDSEKDLKSLVKRINFVVHLAGENRPKNKSDFKIVNTNLTQKLCNALRSTGRRIPVIFTSSTQVELDNLYGLSKLSAEKILREFSTETGSPVHIYRLPNVFGKWCKPEYNSVVATFCYNISNDFPIEVHNVKTLLRLVYIDDVIDHFLKKITNPCKTGTDFPQVFPEYKVTLGELVSQIKSFKNCRESLTSEEVGSGFLRALYSTFMSYLPPERFSYIVPKNSDSRGIFVEILKTKNSGQFSFFTVHPGVTRGGHYHHTKTEKFLVAKGEVKFQFRNIDTNDSYELDVSGETPVIVDVAPGWSHNITNVGVDEVLIILWANEVFDSKNPDTFFNQ